MHKNISSRQNCLKRFAPMLPEGPVLLYGYGAEGRSTHGWLTDTGWRHPVFVTTDGERIDAPGTTWLAPGATWLAPDKLADTIRSGKIAAIVKSPGVSLYLPIFDVARAAGVPVTSNLNLWAAAHRADRTIVAITGTKGKSTTTDLIWRMLRASGINADLAGNGGTPFLDLRAPGDVVVMELSSYQTADMDFSADIAGIINLSAEHSDWHLSTTQYFADKLNMIDRRGDFSVALGAVPAELISAQVAGKRVVPEPGGADVKAIEGALAVSRLAGAHNRGNGRFAARIALAAGADMDGVLSGIASFEPLAHRLEPHEIGGKIFVDDSISTTPVSTLAALETYGEHKIALIGGGGDRGQDYSELARALAGSNVQVLVCLPPSGPRLGAEVFAVSQDIEIIEAPDLSAGMAALAERADMFDVVLLSPGAPSYGQLLGPGHVSANFAERGKVFVHLANALFGPGKP